MLGTRVLLPSVLVFAVACGAAPTPPTATVTTAAASDCTALSKQLASVHDTLEKPPVEGVSPRSLVEGAERDLRATPSSAGAVRELATGYADLLRDFLGMMDRSQAQLAELRERSEALRAPTRPAVSAFKKHCPRADDDEETTSDCSRVRALLESSSRLDPDCEKCTEQLADRLQALAVTDPEVVRLKPDLVMTLRGQATVDAMFRASRATGKRDFAALSTREGDLHKRAQAACPAVETPRIFSPQ